MKEMFLTPIKVFPPPKHTQIKPRCFTCKKFPVCNLKESYLKTAKLIQGVMGDPQKDRELCVFDEDCYYPDLIGHKIHNSLNYFPLNISTDEEQENTQLQYAVYKNKDIVEILYTINNYYVIFPCFWHKETGGYVVKTGREIYYGLKFHLTSESEAEILVGLDAWRHDKEEEEEKEKKFDIINTTHFQAKLECDFYEWEKGLTEEEGIKKIIRQYPNGVPCKDGTFYHLATFHIEPHKVPLYHPENGKMAFVPLPYPVFEPPKKTKQSIARKDRNNE